MMETTNLNTISEEGEDLVDDNSNNTNMNTNQKERIMYIWSVPAKGHSNPALCFTNELLKKLDDIQIEKIVFYSCLIEHSAIKFSTYLITFNKK